MNKKGFIEVICGCMYSGKTAELIRRLDRAGYANRNVQAFKSHFDTRYATHEFRTHSGASYPARTVPLSSGKELKKLIKPTTDIVAIDEVQFFDEEVVSLSEGLADRGIQVIVAGLDLDFRGEPFPSPNSSTDSKVEYPSVIAALMAKAERVMKLTAICIECGEDATRSQRLVNGEPASWGEAVLVVGASDTYEPRCRMHHHIERPQEAN